jgi:hypothetical protein
LELLIEFLVIELINCSIDFNVLKDRILTLKKSLQDQFEFLVIPFLVLFPLILNYSRHVKPNNDGKSHDNILFLYTERTPECMFFKEGKQCVLLDDVFGGFLSDTVCS